MKANSNLGAIARQITQQPPLHKPNICSLPPDIHPVTPAESTQARPMIHLKLAHSLQQHIECKAQEFVAYDYIWVVFMQRS